MSSRRRASRLIATTFFVLGEAYGVMRLGVVLRKMVDRGTMSVSVIDVVVGKVIERMGDEAMRAAVLDAAERLVREEIDRIKNAR